MGELLALLVVALTGWTVGTVQTAWAMRQRPQEPQGIVGASGPSCDPGDTAPLLRLSHEVRRLGYEVHQ